MTDIIATITKLDSTPANGSYHQLRDCVRQASIEQRREVLRTLATQFETRVSSVRLPASILQMYRADVRRIAAFTSEQPDAYFEVTNDAFLKDLGIVTQRVIPAGAEVITESSIARSFVAKARGLTAVRAGWAFLQAGGFAPYFEYHTHDKVLSDFNEAGWRRFYHRVADWLAVRQDVKGLFARTWFLDPVVATISPRLAYLRQIAITEGGALDINVGTDPQSVALATQKSATRRQLYESGKYQPTAYLVVWFRRDLLRWADRFKLPS
jgi:hypothetical protein